MDGNNKTGFSTRNGDVRPSKNLETALQLLAVIFQIQSQEQYGGVGLAVWDMSAISYCMVIGAFLSTIHLYYI